MYDPGQVRLWAVTDKAGVDLQPATADVTLTMTSTTASLPILGASGPTLLSLGVDPRISVSEAYYGTEFAHSYLAGDSLSIVLAALDGERGILMPAQIMDPQWMGSPGQASQTSALTISPTFVPTAPSMRVYEFQAVKSDGSTVVTLLYAGDVAYSISTTGLKKEGTATSADTEVTVTSGTFAFGATPWL